MYRTQIRFGPIPEQLAIHCSDPRYQPHFQEFLRERSGVSEYTLFAVPGGPHSLTGEGVPEELASSCRRWLRFLIDALQPRRAVLIAHEDCRWFQQSELAALGGGSREHQERVLAAARRMLQETLGLASVECYYARRDGENVIFEPV